MALEIKRFISNPIEENTYLVWDSETKEAGLIDCGCFGEDEWLKIQHFIDNNGLTLKLLCCTHAHFDHILGMGFAEHKYGVKSKCPVGDVPLWFKVEEQVVMFMGGFAAKHVEGLRLMTSPKSIAEGDELNIGQYKFEVIGTPGHSQGGVCFYCQQENVLFSGDTLFQGSIGRTDLEGGSYPTLIRSLQEKVFTLPPQTRVLAGHGGETTIDYEIKYNPYV